MTDRGGEMDEYEPVDPDDLENEIEWAIRQELSDGRTTEQVIQTLVDQGWDRDLAEREVFRVADRLVDWDGLAVRTRKASDVFKMRFVTAAVLACMSALLWGRGRGGVWWALGLGLAAVVQFFRGLFGFIDWVEAGLRR